MVYLCQINRFCMKGFFTMTRHERMGTIVILIAIALLLLGNVAVRSCGTDEVKPADVVEMSRFEAEVDSAVAADARHKGSSSSKPDSDKTHRKKGRAKKKSQPERKHVPAPHKMDPVPQF